MHMDVKSMLNNAKNMAIDYDNNVFKRILYNSRQNEFEPLSPWMNDLFRSIMCKPLYLYHGYETDIVEHLVDSIVEYSVSTGIKNFVIGISGGADSATTLAALKSAKSKKPEIEIHAWSLPIRQDEKELKLAHELCDFLGIKLNEVDLTEVAEKMISVMPSCDPVRKGNVYARTRMTYLYDIAKMNNGVVVSTDNFSEYTAGFWTINGDVGDFAPLQSFFKSSEIPVIAGELGLPEKFWRVVPTDGLGISNSDEDQIGMSYLEWDIFTISFLSLIGITNKYVESQTNITNVRFDREQVEELMILGITDEETPSENDIKKLNVFLDRMYSTWYKRYGTIRVNDGVIDKMSLLHYTEMATTIPDPYF